MGKNEDETQLTKQISTKSVNKYTPGYDTGNITMEELLKAMQKSQNHKAAGPDKLEAELFKHLPDSGKKIVLSTLNSWWNTGKVPGEELVAQVAAIFKKGDPKEQENYRPISLLNYIFAMTYTNLWPVSCSKG